VNHPGNNALEDYTVPGFTLWWERAADITEVLNAMLADPMFGQRIDRKRIGAAGFSIGGFTMIELAGGIGDLETYNRFCKSPEADAICKDQQEFPGLLAKGAAMERSDADFRKAIAMGRKAHGDRRIHAVFAIAPGVGQAFHADSLASIAIPVEIVAGANDRVVPVGTNAQYLADHIPHAHVTVYPGGAGHYTFLAACTDLGKKQQPIFCVDAPDVDRAAVHAETARRALAFFDEKLR
jgi:predicted dienelactone hydrolase